MLGAMVPSASLLSFAVTATLLIVIPGPSVLFVISRGVSLGRRAALATVVGNACGSLVQASAVAVGLGAVVARSATLFTAVKLVGAVYLVALGWRAFRRRGELAAVVHAATAPRSRRRIVREGAVVGVSNPKTIVFFAAVLPQFVDQASSVPAAVQMLALGLVFAAISLVSDSVWGLAAGTARNWLGRSPQRLAVVGGAGGLAIMGLGVRLALTGRRD